MQSVRLILMRLYNIPLAILIPICLVGCQKVELSDKPSSESENSGLPAATVQTVSNAEVLKKLEEFGKELNKISEIRTEFNELKEQLNASQTNINALLSNSNSKRVDRIAKTDLNLFDATAIGDVLRVEELLAKKGVKVDLKDGIGSTALHYAASNGRARIVQMLIEAGANVNELDNNKVTALNRARFLGNEETIRTLLDNKAIAVEIINPLTAKNKLQSNVEEVIAAVSEDSVDLLKKQEELGFDLGLELPDGQTILIAAAKNGSINIVKYLLGKSPVLKENTKNSAVIFNAFEAMNERRPAGDSSNIIILTYIELIKILIKEVPSAINFLKKGFSPLHIAITENHVSLVKLLLEAKADVEQKDPNGITPLIMAITAKDHSHENASFEKEEGHGHQEELVELILNAGANVNAKGLKGRDALLEATKIGNAAVADLLLESGANPDSADVDGVSCLHIAAYRGQIEICRKLLARNANRQVMVKVGPKKGLTPVEAALEGKHQDIVSLLRSK